MIHEVDTKSIINDSQVIGDTLTDMMRERAVRGWRMVSFAIYGEAKDNRVQISITFSYSQMRIFSVNVRERPYLLARN